MHADIDVGKVAAEAAERARIEERLAVLKLLRGMLEQRPIGLVAFALKDAINRVEARSK